jgi:hypothetical protein
MLSEKILNIAKEGSINGCVVKVWLITQPKELQEAFDSLIKSPNANLSVAYRYVCEENSNLPFKRTSFVTHIRGRCTCPVS